MREVDCEPDRGGMRLTAMAVVLLLPVLGSGCDCRHDFNSVRTGKSLAAGFSSYASTKLILEGPLQGLSVTTRDEAKSGAHGAPQFKIQVLSTQFTHLEHEGELRLTFYNDRLYGMAFYPLDIASYIRNLRESGVDLPRRTEPLELSRHVRIWTAVDDDAREYVAWADWRLLDEYASWMACFTERGSEDTS